MNFTRTRVKIVGTVLLAMLGGLILGSGRLSVGLALPSSYEAMRLAMGVILVILSLPIAFSVYQTAVEQSELAQRTISDSRVLQAQRDDERQSLDSLVMGLDVAIFMCDEKGLVLYANKKAQELYSFQSIQGKSLVALTLAYDLETLTLQAAKTKSEQTAEIIFSYPGEWVGLAKAWPRQDGRTVFTSVYDVTDLRRLERVRQDFVSNVSHEMRTPLTIIRAMAESLEDDPDEEGVLKGRYLPKIMSEVDRMTGLVDDLLTLSLAENDPSNFEDCDVAEVFKAAVSELSQKALNKGLDLTYHGLDHLLLQANPNQLTQVALNMIANAINYTQVGSIHVNCTKTKDSALIQIKDTGIGIASEHQQRIFERFYRVDKGRSRQTGGTGLGLSIVRHIVESHGGRVSVESLLNTGSTFTLTFPLQRSPGSTDEPTGDLDPDVVE